MDKLLPCPFCGCSGETVHDRWASRDFWGVACQGKCLVFLDSRCGSEAQAVAEWNRRTPVATDPALLALVDAAREWSAWVGFVHAGSPESRLLQAIRDVVMDAPDGVGGADGAGEVTA